MTTNILTSDVQNVYNVTLELCAGKYEDFSYLSDTGKI